MSKKQIGGFMVGAAVVAAYAFVVRPWYLRWGMRDDEKQLVLPGDDLVRHPLYETTRALTIHAPAAHVWPWLVQIGVGRGGFYTYDALENAAGLNIRSATEIRPEWQDLRVGDKIRISPVTPLKVEVLEPNRALVLHITMSFRTAEVVDANDPRISEYIDWTWAFVLDELAPKTTRLIVRVRGNYKPAALELIVPFVLEPIHFIMERGMMQGIQSRTEKFHG